LCACVCGSIAAGIARADLGSLGDAGVSLYIDAAWTV
jgi:hypothetical protein